MIENPILFVKIQLLIILQIVL